jgi:hypothetical protein
MPTHLHIAMERIDEAQQDQGRGNAVMLMSFIACLANLALIAASPTFAAAVAALGQF